MVSSHSQLCCPLFPALSLAPSSPFSLSIQPSGLIQHNTEALFGKGVGSDDTQIFLPSFPVVDAQLLPPLLAFEILFSL